MNAKTTENMTITETTAKEMESVVKRLCAQYGIESSDVYQKHEHISFKCYYSIGTWYTDTDYMSMTIFLTNKGRISFEVDQSTSDSEKEARVLRYILDEYGFDTVPVVYAEEVTQYLRKTL